MQHGVPGDVGLPAVARSAKASDFWRNSRAPYVDGRRISNASLMRGRSFPRTARGFELCPAVAHVLTGEDVSDFASNRALERLDVSCGPSR